VRELGEVAADLGAAEGAALAVKVEEGAALALAAGQPAAWVVVAALAVMIGLDAAFDV
jgi:hypothetical protein